MSSCHPLCHLSNHIIDNTNLLAYTTNIPSLAIGNRDQFTSLTASPHYCYTTNDMPPVIEPKKYDEVIIVALLLALKEKGGAMNPILQSMSDLDGSRTPSSFEHSLRAANKLASSILARKQAGHPVTMLSSINTSTLASAPATPKSTKRSKPSTIGCILTYSCHLPGSKTVTYSSEETTSNKRIRKPAAKKSISEVTSGAFPAFHPPDMN
jgi:hypothetical protein